MALTSSDVVYTPKNPRQEIIRDAWAKTRLFVLTGQAGTGKTTAALAEALKDLCEGRARKIILARPMIGVDEDPGFLTGDLHQKTLPWMGAFYDVLGDISHIKFGTLVEKHIEILPVGFLRGRTIKHGTLIVDEAQNCTWRQLKMLGTRIGVGGKVVLAGDTAQYDRVHRGGVPLAKAAEKLEVLEGAKIVEFLPEDQLRDDFVRKFLEAMG